MPTFADISSLSLVVLVDAERGGAILVNYEGREGVRAGWDQIKAQGLSRSDSERQVQNR